ncbi:DNA-processing protein DprA [Methylobacterium sp. Leaf89]|uniref:DNA-processing protein DprA n=1 Tax=Methylobacterium sp. Leaf89 TaxID=1736245 RepID=UPI001FCD33D3|nr:DNA-processing protein DprA [Methylobacterium sp. Leaf89]
MADEKICFLALASIRGVGYWTLAHIAKSGTKFSTVLGFQDGTDAIALMKKHGARLESKDGGDWQQVRERALDRARMLFDELSDQGIKLLFASDLEFPRSLQDLADAPAWLFVQGDEKILSMPSIAAVGTRTPSDDGMWLCRFAGLCLSHWKAPTVSGLANGIDQLIHEMSIRASVPTVAVLGTGIFSEYPKGSRALRERIVDCGGAVITEYLPTDSYSGENFVRRNRIQAALAKVLIPVEWAQKSGTAHTVRYAASMNRPIAFLRLPDWEEKRTSFANGIAKNARTFTIPGEGEDFRQFISDALSGGKPPPLGQLKLI